MLRLRRNVNHGEMPTDAALIYLEGSWRMVVVTKRPDEINVWKMIGSLEDVLQYLNDHGWEVIP